MSDNTVWLDGLVVFYPIFQYLEANVPATILPVKYHRTHAFEADIKYYSDYLAHDWHARCEERRKSVVEYLNHLEEVHRTDPVLLTAYVYHLYMGLLSGGQILQKKRQLFNRFNPLSAGKTDGYQVTHFDETIGELKANMRELVDIAAVNMSPETREKMIEHSRLLFAWNNKIVQSVQGVRSAGLKKLGLTVAVLMSVWICYHLIKKLW